MPTPSTTARQAARGMIGIVHPDVRAIQSGNRTTANRWARQFESLGWDTFRADSWDGRPCDLLLALHARHSHDSVVRFHREHPQAPIIVVGTGTDLYSKIDDGGASRESFGLAHRIVILQPLAIQTLAPELRHRARVIHQSAEGPTIAPTKSADCFEVIFLANIRPVKDPLCAARAAQRLPADAQIRIRHFGGAIDASLTKELEALAQQAPKFSWHGAVPPEDALHAIAESHLLISTSRQEGGANVISEALAMDVPVLGSRIPGTLGLLGENYPGIFNVSDDEQLAQLILRAAQRGEFYQSLQTACRQRAWLADPRTELESWRRLLSELFDAQANTAS